MATGSSLSTAALRRLKKKKQKETAAVSNSTTNIAKSQSIPSKEMNAHFKLLIIVDVNSLNLRDSLNIEIEYVAPEALPTDSKEFSAIFEKFRLPSEAELAAQRAQDEESNGGDEAQLARYLNERNRMEDLKQQQQQDEESSEDEASDSKKLLQINNSEKTSLSRRKLKKLLQMSLATLKEYSRRPELVEWEDVTARDPKFLINLKCIRNSVPVPKHWNRKRKYLAGKRGFVKPPFDLPAFIKATGIGELRDAMKEQDATKNVKVRAREKMHPKMGRMSIDYEKLHDAFFLHQTKPPLSKHGELYFEGKELEGRLKDKRPGFLTEELRFALGMASLTSPPPWIFAMQKFGPPPAYPHLRIPGLNSPIPEGAQWGFHPGGWGKPPVNDPTALSFTGRLAAIQERTCPQLLQPINNNIWGEFEPEDEEDQIESTQELIDQ
jgi:splicing factor 3B subunit 2